jgi:hypothetical protein
MFVILKPEMKKNIEMFDPYLIAKGFNILSRHPIPNWEKISKQIYAPQLKNPEFLSDFNAYLWLSNNFFGNQGVVYKLDNVRQLKNNLEGLMELKKEFRHEVNKKLDYPITILLNLDKLNIPQKKRNSKIGTIKIGNAPLEKDNFYGRWDNFFFKYVHSSDNLKGYNRENQVLIENKIYNSKISNLQWEQMKKTQTLIPLRDLGDILK